MRAWLDEVAGAALVAAGRRAGVDHRLAALAAVVEADHPGAAALGLPAARDEDDRLEDLVAAFDLTSVDRALLAVAAAGELDPNLALLLGVLAGADGAAWPTQALALELCGVSSLDASVRARLNPLAPLVDHGLLELVGSGPGLTRQLRVPPRVVGHLLGDDLPDPRLAPVLREPYAVEVDPAPLLGEALRRGVRLAWLRTPMGAAGAAVACGGVRLADSSALVVDLDAAAERPHRVDHGSHVHDDEDDHATTGRAGAPAAVVRAAVLEAGLRGEVLVLLGAGRLAPDHGPSLVHLLERCVSPVVGVADRGWDMGWSQTVPWTADAPHLDAATRLSVWSEALDGTGVETDPAAPGWVDLLAMRLTPDEIHRSVRSAHLDAVVSGAGLDLFGLHRGVRRSGSTGGEVAAARTGASLADLVLPDAAMADVRRLISWARHRDEVLAQGPIAGAGGKGRGIAAMFGGAPGTGKTLAAHVVADALGLELMRVDLTSIVDKYIGETEKKLERIFHEAESRNVVLFFDEADSVFGSRSAVQDARDRYANLEVSYLLQRMEQFDGITILATNLRGNLDPAFSRRLQFMITFPDPDRPTRLGLWRQHLSHVARPDPDDPPDVEALADHVELAGGDIRNIVMGAAYDAAGGDGGVVGMRHLVTAALREYTKLRRRPPEALVAAAAGR
jgi:hypothetical protein